MKTIQETSPLVQELKSHHKSQYVKPKHACLKETLQLWLAQSCRHVCANGASQETHCYISVTLKNK